SDLESRDGLGLPVNRAECPHIAHSWIIVILHVSLFLADESPDFIKLQIVAGKIPHFLIEYANAALANLHAEAHNRIPMNTSHALDAANTGTFRQSRYDSDLLFVSECV
ncbi:MAG TPA: hypothetical protein VGK77_01870, partial [Candidatus Binatia bacterium]